MEEPCMTNREGCAERDAADALAPLSALFDLPQGTIYLDGNSLGAMPARHGRRVAQVVREEWGRDLIQSWNTAGWIDLPQRVGDKIARLIGAGAGRGRGRRFDLGEPLQGAERREHDRPRRSAGHGASSSRSAATSRPISTSPNRVARSAAWSSCSSTAGEIAGRLGEDVALLMLTQVNYRTGRRTTCRR
jgi:kynureninase